MRHWEVTVIKSGSRENNQTTSKVSAERPSNDKLSDLRPKGRAPRKPSFQFNQLRGPSSRFMYVIKIGINLLCFQQPQPAGDVGSSGISFRIIIFG